MPLYTAAKRIALGPAPTELIPIRLNRIIVSTADYVEIMPVAEILFVQAAGSYCKFNLINGRRIMVSKTIKCFEEILKRHRFVRPHQSYMVNMQYIHRVRKVPYYAIQLDGELEIPIARARRPEVMAALTAATSFQSIGAGPG